MKGVPVGHKNGEGAKRSPKALRFRRKSEYSKIGTVGPCFSSRGNSIFSWKYAKKTGKKPQKMPVFTQNKSKLMKGVPVGHKNGEGAKDAQRSLGFGKTSKIAKSGLRVHVSARKVIF